jgi:hypothetical protein
MMDEITDAVYLGLCPCGCKIYASVSQGAVIHQVPFCKKFEELEPDDFITYVRRSRGIPDAVLEALN